MLKSSQIIFKGALIIALLVLSFNTGAQRRWKPKPPGVPAELQVTPYKTTMIADGKDQTLITVKVIDSKGDTLPKARVAASFHITGDAHIINIGGAGDFK